MKTAKKRQPLTVHPYIYDMLCNSHIPPPERDGFEERRLNGLILWRALLEERPASEWIVTHPLLVGPAEALVHFLFYVDYDRAMPAACRLILYLLCVVPATDKTVGDAVLREIEPTYENPHPDIPVRLAVFLELAHGPHGPAEMRNIIYACMDELLFDNRIIPYSLQSMPDCTIIKSMTVVYDNGMVSNKREIRRKFRFLDDQNIDLMTTLIKICFKLTGPKKITPKEYCKLVTRACAIDQCVCEFIIKMLLIHLVSHTSLPSPHMRGPGAMAATLFTPAFLAPGRSARAVIKSRTDKYNLFNEPILMAEFLDELNLENAPLILGLMREAYRFTTRPRPIPSSTALAPLLEDTHDRTFYARIQDEEDSDDGDSGGDSEGGSEGGSEEDEDEEPPAGVGGGRRALSKMIETCEGINYSSYRESPSDATPGREYMMPDPNPLLPRAEMDTMRKCLPPHASVLDEAFWLVCFGVPVPDIVCMHRMVRLNSSAVKTYLLDLYNSRRGVYAVLFTYFLLLDENALHYEVDGDLDMWVKHTQAAASHYHLRDGDEIPIVVGRVLACDNCRDVKHPSFYFRKVKAQINGTGKILTTATGLYCAKEPKAGTWQDQYIIDHKERALGAMMTICGPSKFMIGAPRPAGFEPSLVHRRKFGKFISTQIKLHKCADTQLRVLTILGRFTVYDGIVYTGCYGCLRFSPLEELIYYGEDILCEDCVQERLEELAKLSMHSTAPQKTIKAKPAAEGNELAAAAASGGVSEMVLTKTKPKTPRITCAYCNKDITAMHKKANESSSSAASLGAGGAVRSFFLFVDNAAKPEFRMVHFCGSHNNMRWVKQYNIPFLSVVLRGIKHKWGMRNPDGTVIAVGPLLGEAGFKFAKSTL
jgi:hypothetical protein